jgi:hypothetical protein
MPALPLWRRNLYAKTVADAAARHFPGRVLHPHQLDSAVGMLAGRDQVGLTLLIIDQLYPFTDLDS